MEAHPFYTDVLMHSDAELAEALGTIIVHRETIHEWPLSWVQRLLLGNGKRLIYKSQLPPTVEPEFYERASSMLLPAHRTLGTLGDCVTMTFDWIEAPPLRDVARSEADFVSHGRRLVARIGQIRGELPVYLDIGSKRAWCEMTESTLYNLKQLIEDGRFRSIELGDLERLKTWTSCSTVIDAITERPRVVHGDLTSDQVFVGDDGYRVVDWQRPVVAPPEVDLVALLVDRSIEPTRYICAIAVGIFWFLRLHWAVEAQHDLFPDFRGSLFDQWSAEAVGHILE